MSGKPKDLVGEKMGLLTVIRDSGERDKNGGHVMWECFCECGNVAIVNGSRLKKGRTQSCGCLVSRDLIGEKFWKLTVKEYTGRNTKLGHKIWLCECECGNKHEVATGHLQRGKVRSCGCLRNGTHKGNEHKRWRESILIKFGNCCDYCGVSIEEKVLNVHHMNGWDKFVSERFDLDNGVPLCDDCHKAFHKKYGSKDTTKEQYREFKKTASLCTISTQKRW